MKQKLPIGAAINNPGSTTAYITYGWRVSKPVWDKKKCTQCMICWQFCPDNAILEKNGKRIETDLRYCKGCGICENVCPVKCIKMVKEEK